MHKNTGSCEKVLPEYAVKSEEQACHLCLHPYERYLYKYDEVCCAASSSFLHSRQAGSEYDRQEN